MRTQQEKDGLFIKKAKAVLLADEKYSSIDVDKASKLLLNWYKKNRKELDEDTFDKIVATC
jgi:hypothetical protein